MQLRNYSIRTTETYCGLIARLQDDLKIPLEEITADQVKGYLNKRIVTEKISVATINQTISAFKILQVDVLKRPWETVKIKRPRREKKLPVVLSLTEVEKLIAITQNLKHRALLALAYSSGLRRSELLRLKPADIDSSRMQIRVVQGKGNKDRYTILSAKALELLRVYYKIHRPGTWLFEPMGKTGLPLSEQTINSVMKNSARKSGIRKSVSFHTLRHCFATHLLEKGVNIRLIQEFLGHVSLKTTAKYLHLVSIHPGSITSPLDNMNI